MYERVSKMSDFNMLCDYYNRAELPILFINFASERNLLLPKILGAIQILFILDDTYLQYKQNSFK